MFAHDVQMFLIVFVFFRDYFSFLIVSFPAHAARRR